MIFISLHLEVFNSYFHSLHIIDVISSEVNHSYFHSLYQLIWETIIIIIMVENIQVCFMFLYFFLNILIKK